MNVSLTVWFFFLSDILTKVDDKLNEVIDRSNSSAVATDDIGDVDIHTYVLAKVTVAAKYTGHIIHEIATIALNILNKGLTSLWEIDYHENLTID